SVTWFSFDPESPRVRSVRESGGRAVFVRGGLLILAEGTDEVPLIELTRVPMTHEGRARFQVENVLAASAACWNLGLPLERVRAGLESFAGSPEQIPGRFNVLKTGDATVIVDYAHNASALIALSEATNAFPHHRSSIVYASSDRREGDVVRQGEVLGGHFH